MKKKYFQLLEEKPIILWTIAAILCLGIWLVISCVPAPSEELLKLCSEIKELIPDIELDLFYAQASLTFISVSVLTMLSDKSIYIYWEDQVQRRLIRPIATSFLSLTVYSFILLASSFLVIIFDDGKRADITALIYFFLSIIVLGILTFKMTGLFFDRKVRQKELKQEFENLYWYFFTSNKENLYKNINSQLEKYSSVANYIVWKELEKELHKEVRKEKYGTDKSITWEQLKDKRIIRNIESTLEYVESIWKEIDNKSWFGEEDCQKLKNTLQGYKKKVVWNGEIRRAIEDLYKEIKTLEDAVFVRETVLNLSEESFRLYNEKLKHNEKRFYNLIKLNSRDIKFRMACHRLQKTNWWKLEFENQLDIETIFSVDGNCNERLNGYIYSFFIKISNKLDENDFTRNYYNELKKIENVDDVLRLIETVNDTVPEEMYKRSSKDKLTTDRALWIRDIDKLLGKDAECRECVHRMQMLRKILLQDLFKMHNWGLWKIWLNYNREFGSLEKMLKKKEWISNKEIDEKYNEYLLNKKVFLAKTEKYTTDLEIRLLDENLDLMVEQWKHFSYEEIEELIKIKNDRTSSLYASIWYKLGVSNTYEERRKKYWEIALVDFKNNKQTFRGLLLSDVGEELSNGIDYKELIPIHKLLNLMIHSAINIIDKKMFELASSCEEYCIEAVNSVNRNLSVSNYKELNAIGYFFLKNERLSDIWSFNSVFMNLDDITEEYKVYLNGLKRIMRRTDEAKEILEYILKSYNYQRESFIESYILFIEGILLELENEDSQWKNYTYKTFDAEFKENCRIIMEHPDLEIWKHLNNFDKARNALYKYAYIALCTEENCRFNEVLKRIGEKGYFGEEMQFDEEEMGLWIYSYLKGYVKKDARTKIYSVNNGKKKYYAEFSMKKNLIRASGFTKDKDELRALFVEKMRNSN